MNTGTPTEITPREIDSMKYLAYATFCAFAALFFLLIPHKGPLPGSPELLCYSICLILCVLSIGAHRRTRGRRA